VTVGILLTNGRHLHYRIISLNCEVWDHKTSLIPPLVIEVPVHSRERERSCRCILVISILTLFFDFSIRCWNCSDSVMFLFGFHFILENKRYQSFDLPMKILFVFQIKC